MLFRVASRCIILRDSSILVQLSKHGDFYRLPGGRVRPDETIIQGLRREIREELGLDELGELDLLYVVESFYRRRNGIVHELGFYFKCSPPSLDAIKPREEHLRIRWVPLSEISPDKFRPSALAGYLRMLASNGTPRKPIYIVNIDVGEE